MYTSRHAANPRSPHRVLPAPVVSRHPARGAAAHRGELGHRGPRPRRGRADPARRGRPARGRGRALLDPRSRGAALDYAAAARRAGARSSPTTSCVVMRVYFEKPRTTVGWKGLINDPHLDGSFAINEGLRVARGVPARRAAELGLPRATEFLDPISPQFIVRPGVVGSDRRAHDGEPGAPRAGLGAVDAGRASRTAPTAACRSRSTRCGRRRTRTHFLGVTEQGLAAIVGTRGNRDCHVILRGGQSGPNYERVERPEGGASPERRRARPAPDDRHEPRQQREGQAAPAGRGPATSPSRSPRASARSSAS